MTPGQTIAKTPVKLVNDFTGLIDSAHIVGAVSALGGSPDVYSNLVVNNQNIKSPLLNVKAPLAQIPSGSAESGATWFDEADGTTSVITVPKTASGDVLVQGPTSFTIASDLSPNANGSNSFPTTLACTAVSGEDLDIARIHINPVGQQNLDVTDSYACDNWQASSVPTDGTSPGQIGQFATGELKLTLPTAVSPGETITPTNVSLTVPLPTAYGAILIAGGSEGWDGVDDTIPEAALGVAVNGQTSTSPLTGMTAPLTPVPAAAPYDVPAAGMTSAITVPADASGSVTISAPRQFTAVFALQLASGATAENLTVQCIADDTDDLTLATIPVVPPAAHASLTATGPKASAYGTAVKVPVGVTAPVAAAPKPAPAGGTQNIDVFRSYSCEAWQNQTSVPTDGTAPTYGSGSALMDVYTEFQATVPAAVNPGSSIPATDFSLTWEVPRAVASPDLASSAGVDQTSLPDTALGTEINGQAGTSALTNLGNAALAPLPSTPSTTPWQIEADGQTSPISVPANATSDLTIQAPQTYDAVFTAEPADPTTGTAVPWALQCTAADPLYLATVRVVRPLPKPAAAPVPTGKVLITTAAGKGVAQATLAKGKATVTIPGTALPVGTSTLKVSYPGDSDTLAATAKTIKVSKTKATPSLAVHVTPGKVAAGAIFPTVNVKLSGPGSAKGGTFTVTVGSVHKSKSLAFDGTGSVQLPPFASAGHKVIRVSYAGNANFVAKTVTAGLNVTKTGLGKFAVKVKPAKIVAKKTRATLLITLSAPDKLGHGLVTVRLAGRVIAKKLITGTGKITLPKFPSAGRKLLHLTFAGNGSVVARTITKPVKVTKPARHHRK